MEDTIVAISTAYGEGAIGIIRMSGEEAKDILSRIFISKNPLVNRKITYGNIKNPNTGKIIDEVLAVFMKGPNTYTCEDVVEINCHGSIVSLRKILAICLEQGAVLASEGEFTKRAFLNGRIDLTQAEAVIDMIKAKTEKTFDVAIEQLEGRLSNTIKRIRKDILDILVNITVNIDYPDEDIEELLYSDLIKGLSQINDDIQKLISTADTGKIIREGLKVAIVGKPNVGKSSLMNALLKESRAIVTEVPGTTRDTIEELVSIKNIPVKLIDTAGIRQTQDAVEKIGIEKSKESFNQADLVVMVVDGSKDLDQYDFEILNFIEERKAIILMNKSDLGICESLNKLESLYPKAQIIKASMKTFAGIETLENSIESLVYEGQVKQEDSLMVTNARHEDLLKKSKVSIGDGIVMAKENEALEFIEVDISRAYELLGMIVGESVTEDVIDEVFARFCLGK